MREDDYVEAKTSAIGRERKIGSDLGRFIEERKKHRSGDRSIERLRRKLVRRCG